MKVRLEELYPALSKGKLELLKAVRTPDFSKMANLSRQAQHECNVLLPVDEETGLRYNPLNKIYDPRLSPKEKERIMSILQPMPKSKRNKLSDTELVQMCSSRYNTTLTDVAKFAEHLRQMVDADVAASATDASATDTIATDASATE